MHSPWLPRHVHHVAGLCVCVRERERARCMYIIQPPQVSGGAALPRGTVIEDGHTLTWTHRLEYTDSGVYECRAVDPITRREGVATVDMTVIREFFLTHMHTHTCTRTHTHAHTHTHTYSLPVSLLQMSQCWTPSSQLLV